MKNLILILLICFGCSPAEKCIQVKEQALTVIDSGPSFRYENDVWIVGYWIEWQDFNKSVYCQQSASDMAKGEIRFYLVKR